MILSAQERRRLPARARMVPVVSTLAGSLLHAAPVVASAPVLPPFGLLMLLSWRLLRPELWHAWIALPLGLFDDLAAGHPPGSAMTLWTFCFLLLDTLDSRLIWRDYWIEWSVAAALITLVMLGGWTVAVFVDGDHALLPVIPQLVVTILCFPATVRLCATLDRWRLRR